MRGALDAVATSNATLMFFGDARAISPLIRGTKHEAVHAPRLLEVDDPLRATLRGGVDSSMHAAIRAIAGDNADAAVSAGSTGGLMALSRHLIGTLPGIRRPAIAKTLAGEGERRFRMLDLGANIGVGPAQLHQFALMGCAAASADGVQEPAVALLNIGSELRKGPRSVRAAANLLADDARLRYAGYIEPDRMFGSSLDVVVVDGYVGNIALKAAEGAVRMAHYLLGRELVNAAASGQVVERLQRVRDAYNPQRYNGAALLGLNKVVVKSHGGADRQGFANAVAQAIQALSAALVAQIAARA